MGVSQGGPVAIEYTRRHPERVSRLILVGAFIKGRRARSLTPDDLREFEMQRELIRLGWGRDEHSFRLYFSSVFMPDADPQLWTGFAELMRRTTSAENALRLFDACLDMDVVKAAESLDLPTLVLHARGDTRIPFEQGVQLATRIRGRRLVPLDSRNHLLRPDEPAWAELLREVEAFLAEDESTWSPPAVPVLSKDARP
jgi:pimeloyl-ACP methyl ester carboxylesterase